jgi:hypothetical protein
MAKAQGAGNDKEERAEVRAGGRAEGRAEGNLLPAPRRALGDDDDQARNAQGCVGNVERRRWWGDGTTKVWEGRMRVSCRRLTWVGCYEEIWVDKG